jgi:hypothetical protein
VPQPADPAAAHGEHDEDGERELDRGREGERLEHADALAEAAHHCDLHRARQAGEDGECDRQPAQAVFEPFRSIAFSTLGSFR